MQEILADLKSNFKIARKVCKFKVWCTSGRRASEDVAKLRMRPRDYYFLTYEQKASRKRTKVYTFDNQQYTNKSYVLKRAANASVLVSKVYNLSFATPSRLGTISEARLN